MSQVQVKILCQVITAQLGTLNTGAIVRTDAEFAKHLVEDCGAAEYVKPVAKAAVGGKNVHSDSKPKVEKSPKKPDQGAPEVQTSARAVEPANATPVEGDGALLNAAEQQQ